jgi:hypothetical protein
MVQHIHRRTAHVFRAGLSLPVEQCSCSRWRRLACQGDGRTSDQRLLHRAMSVVRASSIADRICHRRHRDWIEAFLVSLREVRSEDQHRKLHSAEQHKALA